MRASVVALASFISLLASGCSSLPDRQEVLSASGEFLSKAGDMLSDQGTRLAEFTGLGQQSRQQQQYQQEVEALFAQPYIDPLTRYLETHSNDRSRATLLETVATERERRCQVIARRYASVTPDQGSLQRLERGYLFSCPEQVKAFADQLERSQSEAAQEPMTAQQQNAVRPVSTDSSAPASLYGIAPQDDSVELAVVRRQASNCYLLFTIRNYSQAETACAAPAANGDAKAQQHLARISELAGDEDKAMHWATRSAQQQHPEGMLLLGRYYQDGVGTTPDAARGLELIRQAADKGLAEASYKAALAYRDGKGTAINTDASLVYMARAGEQNHLPAQLALATHYLSTGGTQATRGRYWLLRAAAAGSARAQFRLAESYATGTGGPANIQAAYEWYSLALLNGESRAQAEVDALAPRLTAEQLRLAQANIQSRLNGLQ
ncbi:MAG: sel1 repeat family protein [Gammaproteobacteria bacterium HGW-Gammaproteobacteria-11]|nr:MAG: sel1 repeat family protein [Gammaproteobacteria bacterium HGW-Gammaproteobacteria-11]